MVLQGLDRRQLVVAAAAAFTEQLLGIAEAAGSDLAHVSLREAGFAPDLEARHRLFCLHDPNAPALAECATGTLLGCLWQRWAETVHSSGLRSRFGHNRGQLRHPRSMGAPIRIVREVVPPSLL